jgi:hypothetical protein
MSNHEDPSPNPAYKPGQDERRFVPHRPHRDNPYLTWENRRSKTLLAEHDLRIAREQQARQDARAIAKARTPQIKISP